MFHSNLRHKFCLTEILGLFSHYLFCVYLSSDLHSLIAWILWHLKDPLFSNKIVVDPESHNVSSNQQLFSCHTQFLPLSKADLCMLPPPPPTPLPTRPGGWPLCLSVLGKTKLQHPPGAALPLPKITQPNILFHNTNWSQGLQRFFVLFCFF